MADRVVLILGASGRLGRMLRRIWAGSPPPGWQPVWQVRDAGGARPGDISWDPLGNRPLPAAVASADAVLCLLGVTGGSEDALACNTALGLAGLRAARATGARRCLIASSAAVYGPVENASEDDAPTPVGAYGRAKLAMEAAVLRDTSPGTTLLRIGNVAGADALLGGAVGRGGPVLLDRFADGTGPIRSYIGPASLARVLSDLLSAADLPGVLNVAAPGAVSMASLLDAGAIPWQGRPALDGAVQRVTMDTTRLQSVARLPEGSAHPAELVRQWRAFGGPP